MGELQSRLDAAFPDGVRVSTNILDPDGHIFWAARVIEDGEFILLSPVGSEIVSPYEYSRVEFDDESGTVLFHDARVVGGKETGVLRLDTAGDQSSLKTQIKAEQETFNA